MTIRVTRGWRQTDRRSCKYYKISKIIAKKLPDRFEGFLGDFLSFLRNGIRYWYNSLYVFRIISTSHKVDCVFPTVVVSIEFGRNDHRDSIREHARHSFQGNFRKHFPMRTNSCSLYEQVMSITVTPTTSAVGIKAGFGPGASNTNSWVPIGIGPVESSSSSEIKCHWHLYKLFDKLQQMGPRLKWVASSRWWFGLNV